MVLQGEYLKDARSAFADPKIPGGQTICRACSIKIQRHRSNRTLTFHRQISVPKAFDKKFLQLVELLKTLSFLNSMPLEVFAVIVDYIPTPDRLLANYQFRDKTLRALQLFPTGVYHYIHNTGRHAERGKWSCNATAQASDSFELWKGVINFRHAQVGRQQADTFHWSKAPKSFILQLPFVFDAKFAQSAMLQGFLPERPLRDYDTDCFGSNRLLRLCLTPVESLQELQDKVKSIEERDRELEEQK